MIFESRAHALKQEIGGEQFIGPGVQEELWILWKAFWEEIFSIDGRQLGREESIGQLPISKPSSLLGPDTSLMELSRNC